MGLEHSREDYSIKAYQVGDGSPERFEKVKPLVWHEL